MEYQIYFAKSLLYKQNINKQVDILNRSISFFDVAYKNVTGTVSSYIDATLYKAEFVVLFASLYDSNDESFSYLIEACRFFEKNILFINDIGYVDKSLLDVNLLVTEPFSENIIKNAELARFR